MRISDWSSDVCSSDLHRRAQDQGAGAGGGQPALFPSPDAGAALQYRDRQGLQCRHRRQGEARVMGRSEEHTSELQSLMRISYAVFCLKKKKKYNYKTRQNYTYNN